MWSQHSRGREVKAILVYTARLLPYPTQRGDKNLHTVVPKETFPWLVLTSTHHPSVGQSSRRRKGMELWLLGYLFPGWYHKDPVLQQHVSLTSLLESHGHSETQALKAALGLPCLLALHICQPHPSPRPRLMNETCSPSYWSPEAISQLLSIDLVHTPGAPASFLCPCSNTL